MISVLANSRLRTTAATPQENLLLRNKVGWPQEFTSQELYVALYALGIADLPDDQLVQEFRAHKSAVMFAIQSYRAAQDRNVAKLVWRIQRLRTKL